MSTQVSTIIESTNKSTVECSQKVKIGPSVDNKKKTIESSLLPNKFISQLKEKPVFSKKQRASTFFKPTEHILNRINTMKQNSLIESSYVKGCLRNTVEPNQKYHIRVNSQPDNLEIKSLLELTSIKPAPLTCNNRTIAVKSVFNSRGMLDCMSQKYMVTENIDFSQSYYTKAKVNEVPTSILKSSHIEKAKNRTLESDGMKYSLKG